MYCENGAICEAISKVPDFGSAICEAVSKVPDSGAICVRPGGGCKSKGGVFADDDEVG